MKIDPQTGLVKVSGWPMGVDNRRADFDLPDDTLRDGVNVDVLTSGQLRRRRGVSRVVPDSNAHSIFANAQRMVWATPTTLRMMDTTGGVKTLLTDTRLANTLSWVDMDGVMYFSNEQINGIVNASGAYEPWGIAVPTTAPTLVAPTGPYMFQVTCTFVTSTGEESGAPLGAQVSTTDPAQIVLMNIPQSADSRVVATRIYATEIDGEAFFRVVDIPAGLTTYAIEGPFGGGMSLTTQFNGPPPPGQLLEVHKGVIYIASGNTVWYTMPFRPRMVNNQKAFFQYPERVTLIKGVSAVGARVRHLDGMFVSSNALVFLRSVGSEEVEQIPIAPIRAVEGAVCNLPQTTDIMIFTDRGFVRCRQGGEIEMLTEKQLAPDRYNKGTMGHVQFNGHQAIIAIFDTPTTAGYASPDYAAGDALRRSELA